ncbi:ABC1 kinase family protein [Aliamphritea spongicola]|uniref:ABC1 kinase family protein n=1 Tax=Aliamphritea spongicola TaxID=707589 RepID=UPI00196B1113|nr:AarF/ABC1/UbiB kinase family protein [Aliamphritea spongicola]MBN3564920.1 AarF/ABC1/UbiB kinase family protein [Aliamphritea spongicola]
MAKERTLSAGRTGRLLKLGRLVGGIAGEMLYEGTSQLVAGKQPRALDLLLTPANARQLTERLSEMRGAAMKVGQLLSMEAGDYLPAELTDILARLRESAYSMPREQLVKVLQDAWGQGWENDFEQFCFTPLAAASIGQVHEARSKGGQHLAIKIQYPGIRDSIDSDVNNVASLLKILRLVPKHYDLTPLLEEAKQQLHQEADYFAEAGNIAEYQRYLGDDVNFELPVVDRSRSTADVLSMSFVPGVPIESLITEPESVRNQIATRLLALPLREVFEWGLVQTDANFSNYRYQPGQGRIGLLDFGATRRYHADFIATLNQLMNAASRDDFSAIETHAAELGYLRGDETKLYRQGLCRMIYTVTEPLRGQEIFDFGRSDLSQRVAEQAISLRLHQRYMHLPSSDVLFLHRKFAGTYLLCARLRAQVDIGALMSPYIQ